MKRTPAVAGQFYPGDREALHTMLERLIPGERSVDKAIGLISPHAGYVYSGAIAGATFARTRIPSRVVILGPNHHGQGHPAAVDSAECWQTPLGEVAVDRQLAAEIVEGCALLVEDDVAHRFEHSLEVQVPFIQYLSPQTEIVPICLSYASPEQLFRMGQELGAVLLPKRDDVLLVASSDMTHYESGESARVKDLAALEKVLALDADGLYETVRSNRISMCGVIPTVVMLEAARVLGADEADLVRYGNSGDVTGDQSEVVGYAGVVVR